MKNFGKLFLFIGIFLPLSSQAASETYECQFLKRLDESSMTWSDELEKEVKISTFEDMNDFIFEEYSWLLIESVTGGWMIRVGAMIYGDGQFSTEPQTITKSLDGDISVFLYNNPEGDAKWQIHLNPRSHITKFIAEDQSGKLIDTAEFICE